MWSELLMTSAISCPLWSSVYECQKVECAFTSPVWTKCGMFVMYCMVLHLYWSRPAQCLVAHHGYWVPCGSRLNCAGSWSRLEPQRYSVHDPSACGYALALTNPITCCLVGRCLQARRTELRNQTTLSQVWVK